MFAKVTIRTLLGESMGMPNSGSLLAYDFSTTRVLLAMDVFCIICILFFFSIRIRCTNTTSTTSSTLVLCILRARCTWCVDL